MNIAVCDNPMLTLVHAIRYYGALISFTPAYLLSTIPHGHLVTDTQTGDHYYMDLPADKLVRYFHSIDAFHVNGVRLYLRYDNLSRTVEAWSSKGVVASVDVAEHTVWLLSGRLVILRHSDNKLYAMYSGTLFCFIINAN